MTAEELTKQLQKLPPETPVLVEGYEIGYDDIVDLKPQKVVRFHDAEEWDGEYENRTDEPDTNSRRHSGLGGLLSHIRPDPRFTDEESLESGIGQTQDNDDEAEKIERSAIVLLGRRGHLRKVGLMTERKSYMLSELVAQCDPDAPVPQDMKDWENAAPVGLEQTVMDSQVDIREAVWSFGELASETFNIDQLVLYGSRARGDYRAESDANVAVLLRGEPREFVDTKLALADLAYEVLLLSGIRIRPFSIWETEWHDPERFLNPDVLKDIAREGVIIWQA
jgi:antitoxin ChpS